MYVYMNDHLGNGYFINCDPTGADIHHALKPTCVFRLFIDGAIQEKSIDLLFTADGDYAGNHAIEVQNYACNHHSQKQCITPNWRYTGFPTINSLHKSPCFNGNIISGGCHPAGSMECLLCVLQHSAHESELSDSYRSARLKSTFSASQTHPSIIAFIYRWKIYTPLPSASSARKHLTPDLSVCS